jgi:hypothetical protein
VFDVSGASARLPYAFIELYLDVIFLSFKQIDESHLLSKRCSKCLGNYLLVRSITHGSTIKPVRMPRRTHLPLELWNEIAFFACRDGGRTATSLLLVSKAIARAAEEHVYSIVALMGRRAVESFLALLAGLPPVRRARIHAVFVYDGNPTSSSVIRKAGDTTTPQITWRELMVRLVALVSSSLHTLALISNMSHVSHAHMFTMLKSLSLPALQSLTLRGDYPFLLMAGAKFPALDHLHVHVPNGESAILRAERFVIGAVSLATPRLRHLSLSGLPTTVETRRTITHFLSLDESTHITVSLYPGDLQKSVTQVTLFTRRPVPQCRERCTEEPRTSFEAGLMIDVGEDRVVDVFGMPEYLLEDSAQGWRTFWLDIIL